MSIQLNCGISNDINKYSGSIVSIAILYLLLRPWQLVLADPRTTELKLCWEDWWTPKKLERVFDVIGFSRKTPKRKSAKSFSKHLNLKASFKFLQGIFKTSSNFATFCNNKTSRNLLDSAASEDAGWWWLGTPWSTLGSCRGRGWQPWFHSRPWPWRWAVLSVLHLVSAWSNMTHPTWSIQHDLSNMIYQIIQIYSNDEMMKWWFWVFYIGLGSMYRATLEVGCRCHDHQAFKPLAHLESFKWFIKIKNMKSLIDTGRTTGNVWMKTHRAAWWLRRLILEPLTLAGRIDNINIQYSRMVKPCTQGIKNLAPAVHGACTSTKHESERHEETICLAGKWRNRRSSYGSLKVQGQKKHSKLQMMSADLAQLISVPASHKDMKGLSSHRQI